MNQADIATALTVAHWERQMPRPEPKPVKQRTAATSQVDWSGWEDWLRVRLDAERRFLLQIIGEELGQMLQRERKTAKRELADEVRSLRFELTQAGE